MVIYSVRGGFALSRAYRFPSQNGKRVVELKQTIQVIHNLHTHKHTHIHSLIIARVSRPCLMVMMIQTAQHASACTNGTGISVCAVHVN